MESNVQIKTKKGGYQSGVAITYTGNFAILVNKTVSDKKLIITHKIFALEDIADISISQDAEIRSIPELITESMAPDCLCGNDCNC